MGFLSFLNRLRASSSDRSEWGDFWFKPVSVRTSSGMRVSADNALRLAAVYASVRILAETMASLPFVLYRQRADGGKDRVTDHWLVRLFAKRPNRYQNPYEWREILQGHLALRGNAYNRIVANGRREIVELVPIHPDRIRMELTPSGDYRYRVTDRDAQFLELRKFRITDIARLFRVPPHMIADLDRATFSNIEQQSLEFVMHTMAPWVERWEASLEAELLFDGDDLAVEFGFANLMRSDAAGRSSYYQSRIQDGRLAGRWSPAYRAVREARREAATAVSSGGIAVLPLYGVVTQRGNMVDDVSGPGSVRTQQFASVLGQTLADDSVSQILIDIDTPGGGVYGVSELADEVTSARAQKPMVAIANSLAASASYWIGCSVSEFYVAPGGEVGSIAVWQAHFRLPAGVCCRGREAHVDLGRQVQGRGQSVCAARRGGAGLHAVAGG